MAFWNCYANSVETGNNGVIKTGASDLWDSAARSLVAITGPCTVSFQCPDLPLSSKMLGLGIGTLSASYTNREFAIYVHPDGKFYVYESGTYRGEMGLWVTTDTFKVVSDGAKVTYYHNDAIFYRSTVTPAATLYAEAVFSHGTVTGVSAFDNVTFAAGIDVPLQWDLTNVTASAGGTTLTKTGGASDWSTAGAQSVFGYNKNCYIEFRHWATEATLNAAHGAVSLGPYTTGIGLYNQEAALCAWDTNLWSGESGYNVRTYITNRGHTNTQGFKGRESTDVFRLERINDRVYAYKNGRRFWASWPAFYSMATQVVYAAFSSYAIGGEVTDIVFEPIPGPSIFLLSNVDFPRLPTKNALSFRFQGYWDDLDTTVGVVQIGPTASGPWTTMWSYASGFESGYSTGSVHTVTSAAKDERIRIAFEADLDPATTYYVRAEIFNVLGESTVKEFSFETTTEALAPTVIASGSSATIGTDTTRAIYDSETDAWSPDIRASGKPYLSSYSDATMQSSLMYESDGQIIQQSADNPAGTMNLAYKDVSDNWSVVSDALMTGVSASSNRSLLGTSHGGRRVYWGANAAPPTIISYDFNTGTVGRIQCLEAAVSTRTMVEFTGANSDLGQKHVTEDGLKIVGPYEISGTSVWVRISEDGGATWERVALPRAIRQSLEGPGLQLRGLYGFYWIDSDHLLLTAGTEGGTDPNANSGYNRLSTYILKWSTREWDAIIPPDIDLVASEGNFGLYQAWVATRVCWPMPGNRIWWRTPGTPTGNTIAVTDYNGCILACEVNPLKAQPNSATGVGYYGGGLSGTSQWASPTEFTCVSQQDTSLFNPSRHVLHARHTGFGHGGVVVQPVDIGSVLSSGYIINVFGSYEFASLFVDTESSISLSFNVNSVTPVPTETNISFPFSFNISQIETRSSLPVSFNIASVQLVGKPNLIEYYNNPFNAAGSLLSLSRLPREKNHTYKQRIFDTYANLANSTYRGLVNGITRELGYTIEKALVVNPRKGDNGEWLATDPVIVFDGVWLHLYEDFSSNVPVWTIDRFQKGGNYETLNRLVDFINNETTSFEASLYANTGGQKRSCVIFNQSNRHIVLHEFISSSNCFKLEHNRVRPGTLFFSNPTVFASEVSLRTEVVSAGQYYVDYWNGVITSFLTPRPLDFARYEYIDDSFTALSSPVILHDINSESFKTKMFEQVFSDDQNNYVNGILTEMGVDIINELLSISPMYWGK